MTDLNEALVDLVDGRLDPAEQRDVERHLEACDNCRALVDRPADHPRGGVHARSARAGGRDVDGAAGGGRGGAARREGRVLRDRRAGARRDWPVWLGAAAALVLATVIGVLPLLQSRDAGTDDAAARPAPHGGGHRRIGHRGIRGGRTALPEGDRRPADIANKDTGELDPQVAAVLQKNLTVIDQAISESRAALKSQPASTNAQDGLFDALRTKVALLQQTVELINEMRKGNQAEAGRKIQTLSQ